MFALKNGLRSGSVESLTETSRGRKVIQEQVDHYARDRDIYPYWKSHSRDSGMPYEVVPGRTDESEGNEGNHAERRQGGVREQDREVHPPNGSVVTKGHAACLEVIEQVAGEK